MSEPYDVAIIGAGPGGAATAHYLALAGLRVLLLDKFSFPRDKTCGDGLTPRALRILDEMGLLERIQAGARATASCASPRRTGARSTPISPCATRATAMSRSFRASRWTT